MDTVSSNDIVVLVRVVKLNKVRVVVVRAMESEQMAKGFVHGDQPSGMKCHTTSRTPVDISPISVKALGDRSASNKSHES